jgi:hypothetical protein
MVTWPHVLGQNIKATGVCTGGGCSSHGRQAAEKELKCHILNKAHLTSQLSFSIALNT